MLAEAHEALGIVYARAGQWDRSEQSFRHALKLEPARCQHFVMNVLLPLGRVDEALRHLHVAEKIDPLSPELNFHLAYVLVAARRFEEAAGYLQKVPASFTLRNNLLGRARLGQGRFEEALQIFTGSDDPNHRAGLGYVYARLGRREEAEKIA